MWCNGPLSWCSRDRGASTQGRDVHVQQRIAFHGDMGSGFRVSRLTARLGPSPISWTSQYKMACQRGKQNCYEYSDSTLSAVCSSSFLHTSLCVTCVAPSLNSRSCGSLRLTRDVLPPTVLPSDQWPESHDQTFVLVNTANLLR